MQADSNRPQQVHSIRLVVVVPKKLGMFRLPQYLPPGWRKIYKHFKLLHITVNMFYTHMKPRMKQKSQVHTKMWEKSSRLKKGHVLYNINQPANNRGAPCTQHSNALKFLDYATIPHCQSSEAKSGTFVKELWKWTKKHILLNTHNKNKKNNTDNLVSLH